MEDRRALAPLILGATRARRRSALRASGALLGLRAPVHVPGTSPGVLPPPAAASLGSWEGAPGAGTHPTRSARPVCRRDNPGGFPRGYFRRRKEVRGGPRGRVRRWPAGGGAHQGRERALERGGRGARCPRACPRTSAEERRERSAGGTGCADLSEVAAGGGGASDRGRGLRAGGGWGGAGRNGGVAGRSLVRRGAEADPGAREVRPGGGGATADSGSRWGRRFRRPSQHLRTAARGA
jgi:hypothetical protein